jgi:hypothetical protein
MTTPVPFATGNAADARVPRHAQPSPEGRERAPRAESAHLAVDLPRFA